MRAGLVPLWLALAAVRAHATTLLYIPLDERFTTRFAFLNLAQTTPFTILTPPMDLLSSMKQPAPLPLLDAWMEANVPLADAMIVSLELYAYGGLINSRCSNDSTATVAARVDQLLAFRAARPQLRLYVSTVVMRIPSYNEDVEEPWYWAYYGADLYEFSFFLDKYHTTHNASDLKTAQSYEALVPPAIVQEFLWRRQRNFNVTSHLLAALGNGSSPKPLDALYITLDDNAQYGLNIAEANSFKAYVAAQDLGATVRIYPGADEVGLTQLARFSVDATLGVGQTVTLRTLFRDPTTVDLIPNYEGQPMILTLQDQIEAAGGTMVNVTVDAHAHAHARPGTSSATQPRDAVLLVNNFSEFPQIEAPVQPMANRSVADYAMFTPFACLSNGTVIGFADNRYSNGADVILIQYMLQLAATPACRGTGLRLDNVAYAGWNTDGNTLGTVIANSILLALFPTTTVASASALPTRALRAAGPEGSEGPDAPKSVVSTCTGACGNRYFNVLRVVEDWCVGILAPLSLHPLHTLDSLCSPLPTLSFCSSCLSCFFFLSRAHALECAAIGRPSCGRTSWGT